MNTDSQQQVFTSAHRLPVGAHLLVVKLSSLGDLFHVLPAVHNLKTALQATLGWVAQSEYADLVRCFTDVDHVIPLPPRVTIRSLRTFLTEIRAREYDAVVDFQGLLRSAVVSRMARSGKCIGPSFHREGSRLLYSAVSGPNDHGRHAVDRYLDIVRFFGLQLQEPRFPVSVPKLALAEPAPRIALMPVSRWKTKNWPVESFAAAASQLQEAAGATLYLIGGRDSIDAANWIESRLRRPVVNCAGRLSLVETGSLLAGMQLVIANDSGPMHMAAALGIPVIAVMGPTDPQRTGPFGLEHRVIRQDLPCVPCFQRRCRYGDLRCLAGIPPERVVEEALQMIRLAATGPESAAR